MLQCNCYYTSSARYNGLSKTTAPPRFHVGANECNTVGLLATYYRLEQLKLAHMFNIINVQVPEHLRTNAEMVQDEISNIQRASA